MHLIITRTFPPDVGGMQNLMWGLARSLSKFFLIKVFADHTDGFEKFDNSVSFSIEKSSLSSSIFIDMNKSLNW